MINEQLIPLFSRPVFKTGIDISLDLSNVNWIENYTNSISTSQQIIYETTGTAGTNDDYTPCK